MNNFFNVLVLTLTLLLSGCSNLEFKDYLDAGAVGTVGYLTGGPLVGVATAATEITFESVTIKEDNPVREIKNTPQAVFALGKELGEDLLIGIIFFLIFSNILVPYFHGKNQREKPSKREDMMMDILVSNKNNNNIT
jgi:hypothetical protein